MSPWPTIPPVSWEVVLPTQLWVGSRYIAMITSGMKPLPRYENTWPASPLVGVKTLMFDPKQLGPLAAADAPNSEIVTTRSANTSCDVLRVPSMRLTSLFRMTRLKSVVESVRAYW